MSQDQHQLAYVTGQIRWKKKQMADLEASGLLDKLPTYGTRTNREYYELELKKYERIKTELEQGLRRNRVLSKWYLRKLDRPLKPKPKTPDPDSRWISMNWFLPLRIDDVIQGRRIVDQG